MISNEQLKLEKEYLKTVLSAVKDNSALNVLRQKNYEDQFKELIEYLSSEYKNIDDEEKASANEMLNNISYALDLIKTMQQRLEKQKLSPYFAKIKFKEEDDENCYYIGINNIFKTNTQIPLVCDWRAPISSIYYDFDCGKAHYIAFDKKFEGELTEKRQFKIEKGAIKYCFDTSTTIQDDILIETLANNSSPQMKNIVATIQKEQNLIIRDDLGKSMLIQGIAGSGKTSVALHRVAYLLYNNRDTIKSDNILILSPSKVFSEYISNILPELGENNVENITFDDMAKEELRGYVGELEKREEMLADILSGNDERRKEIEYKSTFEYCQKLKSFVESYFNLEFEATDIKIGDKKIEKAEIEKLYYETYKSKIPAVRIEWIADYIIDKLNITTDTQNLLKRIKLVLYPMFSSIDMIEIFSEFLQSIGFEYRGDDKIPNEDIASILYIKNYILGIAKNSEIKYLIIDEMQDYSPVHFEILNYVFDCEKMILGDIYQTFDKNLNENYLKELKILLNSELKELNTCYRSSKEITEFAGELLGKKLNSVDRHNNKPEVIKLKENDEKLSYIESKIFEWKKYNQIAIITKNEESAKKLHKMLENNEYNLINAENNSISKVNIVPINYSKGLEFDACILYELNNRKLDKDFNKKLMYIASTRALHELFIIN